MKFPALKDTTAIIPEGLEGLYNDWHFAPAVKNGEVIYISGIIGADENLNASSDPEAQFVQLFEIMAHTLQSAGADFGNVVELTSYHVDLNDHFSVFTAVKDRYFNAPYCAWSAIGVSALLLPAALVEVKAIAHLS